VLGRVEDRGLFNVIEYANMGIPPQKHQLTKSNHPFSLVFISDMRIGSRECDQLRLEMLFNFLTTEWEQDPIVDEEQDENKQIANIQQQRPHIIIAGSSLVPTEIVKRKFEEFSALPKENVIAPTVELDTLISQLSRAGTVTLLPGTEDPTNCFLPQKPLHHLLLPNSYKYSSFIPATNPHSELVNNM
ncbi:MAG: hypothetical protein EZS28_052756, partial [Streblomastix strix]